MDLWKFSKGSVLWKEMTAVMFLIYVIAYTNSTALTNLVGRPTRITGAGHALAIKNGSLKHNDSSQTNKTRSDGKEDMHSFVQRIQRRITQSREAKWASVSLTAICILLVLGVCYSRMWKDYRGAQFYHPGLPVLKDSIPLIDVLSRKLRFSRTSSRRFQPNARLHEDEEQLLA